MVTSLELERAKGPLRVVGLISDVSAQSAIPFQSCLDDKSSSCTWNLWSEGLEMSKLQDLEFSRSGKTACHVLQNDRRKLASKSCLTGELAKKIVVSISMQTGTCRPCGRFNLACDRFCLACAVDVLLDCPFCRDVDCAQRCQGLLLYFTRWKASTYKYIRIHNLDGYIYIYIYYMYSRIVFLCYIRRYHRYDMHAYIIQTYVRTYLDR